MPSPTSYGSHRIGDYWHGSGPLAKRHVVLARTADYAFSGLFYQLLQFPLFSRFLDERAMLDVDKGRAARNLATFSKLLTKFEYLHHISVLNPRFIERDIRNLFNQFFRFLKDGGIGEYEDEAEYAPTGCVSFLTIHQSKGLEFPVVVCCSLEAVPRKQYSALDEILEDGGYLPKPRFEPLDRIKHFDFRRLYYTAFSRAQNLLVLAAQRREGKGLGKSPSKYFERRFNALPNRRKADLNHLTFEQVKEINLKREYFIYLAHHALRELRRTVSVLQGPRIRYRPRQPDAFRHTRPPNH